MAVTARKQQKAANEVPVAAAVTNLSQGQPDSVDVALEDDSIDIQKRAQELAELDELGIEIRSSR